jgi:isopenicillin-N epimerase
MRDSGPSNRRFWQFAPGLIYLNHGSFGAVPHPVLHAQENFRKQFHANPTDFVIRRLPKLWAQARAALASFLGARPRDLVFVRNATEGVNTVLTNMALQPGDEILVTSHGYAACTNAARAVAEWTGAKVVVADLSFPCLSAHSISSAVANRLNKRTRLVILDHITSPSALILPLKHLVTFFEDHNVPVLVDGAHAPGQVKVNLGRIGASYYVGNCHKWLCAPPGAAFIHVSKSRQESFRPLITSHGYRAPPERTRSLMQIEFDWTGTQDVSAVLAIPAALEFLARHPGGINGLAQDNHAKVIAGRNAVSSALGLQMTAPDDMIGSMASLILPQHIEATVLRERLLDRHHIQTQLFQWDIAKAPVLRLSAQAYNKVSDYEKLAAALKNELLPQLPRRATAKSDRPGKKGSARKKKASTAK